jgi:hypothetical protein
MKIEFKLTPNSSLNLKRGKSGKINHSTASYDPLCQRGLAGVEK